MRKGTCAECGNQARNERSYFCESCLKVASTERAMDE